MTVRLFLTITLVFGSVILGACNTTMCTLEAVPALSVEATDSVSGQRLTEPLVWVKDGAFTDTLEVFGGIAYGPYERPGTYDVHVEHAEYQSWLMRDVRVTSGECHVRTRQLLARLRPAS